MFATTQVSHKSQEQPIIAPHYSRRVISIGLDVTTSFPRQYLKQAARKIADAIDTLVAPNQDGAVVYVSLINHASYNPESTILTITIPAIDADPQEPVCDQNNPYSCNVGENAWQKDLKNRHAQLREIQTQVRQLTNMLRNMSFPIDNIGTSIYGFFARSQFRMQIEQGTKYVVTVSDLADNEVNYPLTLKGVHVEALYYYCYDAGNCNTSYWQKILSIAGASISFFDPAQTEAMSSDQIFN